MVEALIILAFIDAAIAVLLAVTYGPLPAISAMVGGVWWLLLAGLRQRHVHHRQLMIKLGDLPRG